MHARTHSHVTTALTAATALASASVASVAASVVANSATAKAVARSPETVRLKNVVAVEALAAKTLAVATAVAEAAITAAVASCSAMINHETALYDVSGLTGLNIAAFEVTAWISDTCATCRVSAGFVSSQSMMVFSETTVLATPFNAVSTTQNGVSYIITPPESAMGNCFNIFTKEWVPKKSTQCVATKAVVRQTSTRCTERQGAWGSRRATVTVEMQRGTVSQCLVVTMQGVSMDRMEIHQDTDSRFQASTAPSFYFLVVIAFFSLQWTGRLSRVAGRRGFLARLYVGQRPLSITRPFRALPIVLALVAAALVLMPLVHAASAALIAATAALSAANIAYTALLSAIQVEATATAAATLVHTHIYQMSTYIPRRWTI